MSPDTKAPQHLSIALMKRWWPGDIDQGDDLATHDASLARHLTLIVRPLQILAAITASVAFGITIHIWIASRPWNGQPLVLLWLSVLAGACSWACSRVGRPDCQKGDGDLLRLAALHLTMWPCVLVARIVRLLREEQDITCRFRGCRVLLTNPRILCRCGQALPGLWPTRRLPLCIVCPACGHHHSTLISLRTAVATGAAAIRYQNCKRGPACTQDAEPIVLTIAVMASQALHHLAATTRGTPAIADFAPHLIAAHMRNRTEVDWSHHGRRWRLRLAFSVPEQGFPDTDAVLFLPPADIMRGDQTGLSIDEVTSILAVAPAARMQSFRPPPVVKRLFSRMPAGLNDGCAHAFTAVWIDEGSHRAPPALTSVWLIRDGTMLRKWLEMLQGNRES